MERISYWRASSRSAARRLVAAGPVGRTVTAQTDAQMHADILSWSRSQGLFAGLALEGATFRQDLDDNDTLYGKRLENRDIVTKNVLRRRQLRRCSNGSNRYSAKELHAMITSASTLGLHARDL